MNNPNPKPKPYRILNTGGHYETYSGAISGIHAYMRAQGVSNLADVTNSAEPTGKRGVIQFSGYAKNGHYVSCLLDAREALTAKDEPMQDSYGYRTDAGASKLYTVYEMEHAGYTWEIRVWESRGGAGTFGMNVRLGKTNGAHEIFKNTGPWGSEPSEYATEHDAVREAESLVRGARIADSKFSIVLVRK